MEKFTHVKATTVPIPRNDVDTDMIIPAQYLTSISREGYGANLFRRMRDQEKDFPLNQERFLNAKIMVVGSNFGCGSSREHAVWSLLSAGFKAVIGKSFADIFSSNSAKNGLVLVVLPGNVVDHILKSAESGTYEVEVDLESQTATLESGEVHSFDIDPFRKHCILNGLDDIDYILSHKAEIESYRDTRKQNEFFRPVAAKGAQ